MFFSFVLVIFFIGYTASEEVSDTIVGTSIKNVIDDVIEKARSQIPEEIKIPDKYFQGPNMFLCLSSHLEATNIKIRGLNDFSYEIGYKGIIPSTYMFNFNVQSTLNYLFKIILRCLSSIGINSSSPIKLDVKNIKFSGDLKYTVAPPHILLDTMNLQIDGVEVHIDSIFDSSYVGRLISENISSDINSVVTKNSQVFADQLKDLINFYLNKIFPGEIPNGIIIDYTEDEIVANVQAVQEGLEKFLDKIQTFINKLQE